VQLHVNKQLVHLPNFFLAKHSFINFISVKDALFPAAYM